MTETEITQITDKVLQYDLDPPSAEYSPYDHGLTVAHHLALDEVASLVAESLKQLPNGLASSFLEGVLDGATVPKLDEILFAALSNSCEVSSAGTIVDLLLARCHATPPALALRLLSVLRSATDHHAQNTVAYAIWLLPVRSSLASSEPAESMATIQTIREMIDETLSTADLTEYARDTLACKRGGSA